MSRNEPMRLVSRNTCLLPRINSRIGAHSSMEKSVNSSMGNNNGGGSPNASMMDQIKEEGDDGNILAHLV